MFVSVFILAFPLNLKAAKLDNASIQTIRDSGDFSAFGKAYMRSAFFATHRGLTRAKLPGRYRFFVETSGNILDASENELRPAINSGTSPDSYKTASLKFGMGLPYGFAVDMGTSYVLSEIDLSSVYANVSFQAMDLANVVYTDFVPSIAVNAGFNYMTTGPGMYGLQTQVLFGGYHREWIAQVAYALQYTYAKMTDVTPNYSRGFIRHGITSTWPVYEGIFFRQEIFISPLEASFAMAYQF